MGGGPGVGDGGAYVAEVGGFGEYFNAVDYLPGGALPAFELESHHDAAAGLLFGGKRGLGVAGQAAVIHFGHFAAFLQPFGHGLRLGVLFFHAQGQGFAAGKQHPGVERGEQQAGGVGVHRHFFHQFSAAAHHAAHHAAVAVDGFGGGLHG